MNLRKPGRLGILGSVLALGLFALACSPGVKPAATTAPSGGGTAAASPSTADLAKQFPYMPVPSDPAKVKRGGTIRSVMHRPMEHFDITVTTSSGVAAPLVQIYPSLVRSRSVGYTDDVPVPWVAESWEVSKDGNTLTWKLRDGIKWEKKPPLNGRKFTAADVCWTVTYFKEKSVHKGEYSNLQSCEAPDDRTVVWKMNPVNADIFADLMFQYAPTLPREVFEQDGSFKKRAIGYGPFTIENYEQDVKLTTKANPDYWLKGTDGKALPYVDGYEVVIVTDEAKRIAGWLAGQFDAGTIAYSLGPADLGRLKEKFPALKESKGIATSNRIAYVNHTKPPFDDVRVRQAYSLAMNRDLHIKNAWESNGVRQGFIAPGLTFFSRTQDELKKLLPYDTAKARALLESYAKDKGVSLPIRIPLTPYTNPDDQNDLIINDLNAVGFDVQFESNVKLQEWEARKVKGDFIASSFIGGPVNLSLDFFLLQHLHSQPLGGLNFGGFKDARVDRETEAISKELNRDKRKQMAQDLELYLVEQMPVIPLTVDNRTRSRLPWVNTCTESEHLFYAVNYADCIWFTPDAPGRAR